MKKKVLFTISSLQFGGAEKQTIELVNHLDTGQFELFVCYLQKKEHLKDEIKADRLAGIYCLDKQTRLDFKLLSKLARLIRDIRPDTIVCVNLYPALYVHIVRVFLQLPFKIIQVMHTTIARDRYNDALVWLIYRWIINRSDRIVFVCKSQMDYWIKHYGIMKDLSCFIYNGIDLDRFTAVAKPDEKIRMRRDLGLTASDIVVCICAALRPEKNHACLIAAGAILLKKGLPMKILIVGEGTERKDIDACIRVAHMENCVVVAGYQPDVRPFLSVADIVAITSSGETFSIAILEAMAMGKPIVASNIGGTSEQVIPGENGFLFPPGDAVALAQHLEKIITGNLFEQMGTRSRSLVTEKFTACEMVKRYEEILLE